jgi:hypothetical protein
MRSSTSRVPRQVKLSLYILFVRGSTQDRSPKVGLWSGNQALTRCAFPSTNRLKLSPRPALGPNNFRFARHPFFNEYHRLVTTWLQQGRAFSFGAPRRDHPDALDARGLYYNAASVLTNGTLQCLSDYQLTFDPAERLIFERGRHEPVPPVARCLYHAQFHHQFCCLSRILIVGLLPQHRALTLCLGIARVLASSAVGTNGSKQTCTKGLICRKSVLLSYLY